MWINSNDITEDHFLKGIQKYLKKYDCYFYKTPNPNEYILGRHRKTHLYPQNHIITYIMDNGFYISEFFDDMKIVTFNLIPKEDL